ncbi:N-acetylneuraminate synthase family protein [Gammaproteobacteria bacterium]|nr:N-acetylneuraminate synthase family protein [Gammaproteobacteria bacterium]
MNKLIIAEVAQSHDGSFGSAKAFVDLAFSVGANAIKYQIHCAEEESSVHEKWRVKFSEQDESRFEYWKRMEFSTRQWQILRDYSKQKKLKFIVSTFSEKAVDIAIAVKADFIKIASGELNNIPMLNKISKSRIPVIISSGMSSISELKSCIGFIGSSNVKAILHCTTMYPTPLEEVGLEYMDFLKKELNMPIGISDHSSNPNVSIIASYLGAEVFELHLKFHDLNFGPDVIASLNPLDFALAVKGIKDAEILNLNKVNKEEQVRKLDSVKKIFGRSLFLHNDLKKGQVLDKSNIAYKKPQGGMGWSSIEKIVGKKANQDIDNQIFLEEGLFDD